MVRVLRYPRLCALSCAGALVLAVGRDVCFDASLTGWSGVLLVLTLSALLLCLALLSCRFLMDEDGVGVGFLLHVRRAAWDDLAALGALCCNGRRMYLYGMYKSRPDFLNMLHHAPHCGEWGFVVPLSRSLAHAVGACSPFELDLYTGVRRHPHGKKRMRLIWHHALAHALGALSAAAVAALTCALLLMRAAEQDAFLPMAAISVMAATMAVFTLILLYRAAVSLITCPRVSDEGVACGPGLYIPWEEVHFGYVHRTAQLSGLFLLSTPLNELGKPGCPPVRCLSMPDSSSLVLAYLTCCPHASPAVEA